jgi:hypothetical protein
MATFNPAGIDHPQLGKLGTGGSGLPFDPLPHLADPGRYAALTRFFRIRATRAMRKGGVGTRHGDKALTHGAPHPGARRIRIDECVTAAVDFYIHRDYAAAKIDNDSPGMAALSAAAWMDRAHWRPLDETQFGQKGDGPTWYPWNRARNATAPAPDAILTAVESVEGATADMLTGEGCDDVPGPMVNVPGGPSGRGATDGRMEWRETVTREWIERGADGEAYACEEREGEWKMRRGRGRKRILPPCRVNAGAPAPLARYVRHPLPRRAAVGKAGERCAVLHYAPDVDAYRAALAAHYAGDE